MLIPLTFRAGRVPVTGWPPVGPDRFEVSVFRGQATVAIRWYATEWKDAYAQAARDEAAEDQSNDGWGWKRIQLIKANLRKETSSVNRRSKIGPVSVRSTIDFRRPIRTDWLFLPLWVPCTGIAFFLAVYLLPPLIQRWSRKRKGLCGACGYDLTGNLSGVCPECATPIFSAAKINQEKKAPDEDS